MGTLLARVAAVGLLLASSAFANTFPRIEAKFDLPNIAGNPFDFTVNDVRATLAGPDGKSVTLPAFFDGGTTWKVRHAPTAAGKWTVSGVTLNGKDAAPKSIEPREFTVTETASPGYVRVDPKDNMRFAFDDGTPYYPVGYDLAWHHTGEPKMPPLVESLARMKAANVNWTRIWMNAWDGKNLDWLEPSNTSPKPGTLDLGVAKHWDDIVDAADSGNIHFQLTLQHHGQYSTKADANWQINPWNTANGGFLVDPTKFFTDEQAKKLTRAKYRYIIARWGYSPAIMAWELFNEVEYTDAFTSNIDDVAAWHKEMAEFLRANDPYKHLITTSSRTSESKIWSAMDYYQEHVYAPDLITAVQALETRGLEKPYFYGEIGFSSAGPDVDIAGTLHKSLWASLMTNAAGAAQYWLWYEIEPQQLLWNYAAAQKFIRESKLPERRSTLKPIEVIADTGSLSALRFGPGSGWAPSKGTDFNVKRSGTVEGLGGMSAYLQGKGDNNKMFPFARFSVDYAEAGTFAVNVDEMTPAGATLNVSIDDKPVTKTSFAAPPAPPTTNPARQPRNPRLDATIEIPVPAGKHVIKLDNTAPDWIHLRQFTLTPYAAGLAALAKGSNDYAVLWVYRRDASDATVKGTLAVPGLDAGAYRVVWWDTYKGVPLQEKMVNAIAGKPLTIDSGDVWSDVAIFITRGTSPTTTTALVP